MLIQYVVRAIQIYTHSNRWQKLVLTEENESYILEKSSISLVVCVCIYVVMPTRYIYI
jgi:hypothetical protein